MAIDLHQMAATDEGMLVNFDLAEDNFSPSFVPSAIKGGRWRDRFKAKKKLQHYQKKGKTNVNAAIETGVQSSGNTEHLYDRGNESGDDISSPGAEQRGLKRKRPGGE